MMVPSRLARTPSRLVRGTGPLVAAVLLLLTGATAVWASCQNPPPPAKLGGPEPVTTPGHEVTDEPTPYDPPGDTGPNTYTCEGLKCVKAAIAPPPATNKVSAGEFCADTWAAAVAAARQGTVCSAFWCPEPFATPATCAGPAPYCIRRRKLIVRPCYAQEAAPFGTQQSTAYPGTGENAGKQCVTSYCVYVLSGTPTHSQRWVVYDCL